MSDGPPGGTPPAPGGPWPPPGSGPSPPSGQPGWVAPPPSPGQPPPPPGQPAWGQPPPPHYGYYAAPQTEGTAVAVLILAIGAWVLCPIVPAIVALAMAPGARRKIEQSGGRLTGETLVKVGVIVSWINIGLYGLGLVVFIVVVIVAAAVSNTNEALQLVQQLPLR